MNKHYFIINVKTTRWGQEPVYIAETLEEAENQIMNYSDLDDIYGNCDIDEIDKNFNYLITRTYEKGKVINIYNHKS